MKNQGGFAVIHFISFLPLILAVSFCLYLFLSFSDTQLETTQTCLREQIRIQQNVKLSLRSLLKLNPQAIRLHLQYRTAELRLAAAIAAINAPAIAAARLQIQLIYQQRQLLDLQQKALIKMANSQIAVDQQLLKFKILKIAERRKKEFQSFLTNEIQDLSYKKIHLAVVASDQDLAPTYSLSPNFIEDQALEFKWQLKLASQNVVSHFLPYQSQFLQSCSTTINAKENAWPTVTREAKSPWKLRS